jgi:hypothetical protein
MFAMMSSDFIPLLTISRTSRLRRIRVEWVWGFGACPKASVVTVKNRTAATINQYFDFITNSWLAGQSLWFGLPIATHVPGKILEKSGH